MASSLLMYKHFKRLQAFKRHGMIFGVFGIFWRWVIAIGTLGIRHSAWSTQHGLLRFMGFFGFWFLGIAIERLGLGIEHHGGVDRVWD
jgi:hypothetical protein